MGEGPCSSFANDEILSGSWGVYGAKYFPDNIPLDSLTHILYSFANVRQDSGEVYLTDAWADEQMHYTEAAVQPDSWNDAPGTNNLYGALKRFALLKRKNRSLKLMLSIGGWTYSSNFWPSMSTEAGRKAFADTSLRILEDYGFDGIDSESVRLAGGRAELTLLVARSRLGISE